MMFFKGALMNFPDSFIYLLPFLLLPLVVQIPFSLVFIRLNPLGKIFAIILFLVADIFITYLVYEGPDFEGSVVVFRIFLDIVLVSFLYGNKSYRIKSAHSS